MPRCHLDCVARLRTIPTHTEYARMPSIDIHHQHSKTPAQARKALEEVARKLAEEEGIAADGSQVAIKALMLASDPVQDKAASLAALDALIADAAQPQLYRDLATLRRVIAAGSDMPLAERRTALEGISAPGRAFRTLASEQLAYLMIEDGKPADAITALSALMQDQEAPAGLRARAGQMITALGGTPPALASTTSAG